MLNEMNSILEIVTEFAGVFLIERYVFLENGLKPWKQRLYYLFSIFLVLVFYARFGKDFATGLILFIGGLNISLARKEHRLRGFFLVIPIVGIIDGLIVPILILPVRLIISSQEVKLAYTLIVFVIFTVFLLLFFLKGRSWRKWFWQETVRRKLHRWESFLLYAVGVLMFLFSNIAVANVENVRTDAVSNQYALNIFIMGITAFILTVTIIVLIMQGNKRSYYHKQISDMQFNIITTMADIVESRDGNTGGHIRRTAKYVEIIAKTLKKQGAFPAILTDQYMYDMIVAAPLHDIGKIHVSDMILNKPGKLTDEEFQIMKSHAAAGRDMLIRAKEQLGESTYLNIAIDMAAYHHEWWNGKGYPDGIKEEEIPLCARVMAVADVFDALISKRCYKNAMPLDKAYSIIREESGTHFDPVVVDAFFASAKEIEKISVRQDYLFESITEYDIDFSKRYDMKLGSVHTLVLSGYEGEKVCVRLASNTISTLQRDFELQIDDIKNCIDLDIIRKTGMTEAAAKEALTVFVQLPNKYAGKVELTVNAENIKVRSLKCESIEFNTKTKNFILDEVIGAVAINCNLDMNITCNSLNGSVEINQVSATSRISLPKGTGFTAVAKGIKTSISYEKDGRKTASFADEASENVIELNGMKSELVICRREICRNTEKDK